MNVEVGVAERGQPGDVFVQDVVLALVGGQRPQLLDGGVQVPSGSTGSPAPPSSCLA
ncbi:hypothetical protein [Streptomyces sp. NPDC097610]|uniref:hypothetical protein n=1 Tax=Streptomyces sp. NPDC097610 TaxID=3157227 RepID=UPI00331E733A